MRFRIIPLTIVTACFFLMFKIVALIQGGQAMSESLIISRVEAETEAKPKEEPKKEDAKKEEAKAEEGHGEKKAEEGHEEKKPDNENPNISTTKGDTVDRRFTAVELELLQKLSKRREDLDRWESNLQVKEAALDATEKRISDKIEQINAIKKEVSALLAQYNKIEDAEIASLVKIYEAMKPTDAARIFDELEMPVLLTVADRMSEKKAAPIFAAMSSRKAKQLTVELAAQRQIQGVKMNAAKEAVKEPAKPSP